MSQGTSVELQVVGLSGLQSVGQSVGQSVTQSVAQVGWSPQASTSVLQSVGHPSRVQSGDVQPSREQELESCPASVPASSVQGLRSLQAPQRERTNLCGTLVPGHRRRGSPQQVGLVFREGDEKLRGRSRSDRFSRSWEPPNRSTLACERIGHQQNV